MRQVKLTEPNRTMKLQEIIQNLSLASCQHGRTSGPYVQLCQHIKKLHAELEKNPHFVAALEAEKETGK